MFALNVRTECVKVPALFRNSLYHATLPAAGTLVWHTKRVLFANLAPICSSPVKVECEGYTCAVPQLRHREMNTCP